MVILKFETGMDAEQKTGLHSFAETLAFIVSDIYASEVKQDKLADICGKDTTGQIERLNELISWAKEFEQINENREWDDEWYESMEQFIDSKLS